MEGGRERPACSTEGCGYFHFGDSSIGCGGVVFRDGKALLIQRGIEPGRGSWQIPGGYVEVDETIDAAAEREVLEEAGITARVTDVVGFRHAAGTNPERPANLYVVFRLDSISGEPQADGQETMDAGFFSMEEIAGMEKVQALSVWAINQARLNEPGSGFVSHHGDFQIRPGWSIFGLGPATEGEEQ